MAHPSFSFPISRDDLAAILRADRKEPAERWVRLDEWLLAIPGVIDADCSGSDSPSIHVTFATEGERDSLRAYIGGIIRDQVVRAHAH